MSRTARTARPALAVAAAVAAAVLVPAHASAPAALELRVLGTHPERVSAGDVLVEVVGGSPGLRVQLDGRDVTAELVRPVDGPLRDRSVVRLDGLFPGPHQLAATGGGRQVQLSFTSHPAGGPVFSGPQIQPWVCTTAANGLGAPLDEQCNATTRYRWSYRPAGSAAFVDYDPASPPPAAAVATTVTDEGRTVPYVVRVERGTLNRAIYDIAVLALPGQPVEPWRDVPGWNEKLLYTYGGGCAPGHSQAAPPDVLLDMALRRGFAVASSSLNAMGNACNLTVSAETTMMVKERITERYGPIRYTIGDGCSGGAEAQNSLAENYPGLLDGLRPTCTFADAWTPAVFNKSDCELLVHYFTAVSPHLWASPAARAAVVGDRTDAACTGLQVAGSSAEDWDPSTGCKVAGATWTYHPETNPGGVRCTLQDYNANSLGRRSDGNGHGVLDDEGVQWGLDAFRSGRISAEQFVDLNEKIGGWDQDHRHVPGRTRADEAGIQRMYDHGQLTWGASLARTPSIDARSDQADDLHGNVHREAVRARLVRATGGPGFGVHWTEPHTLPNGLPTPVLAERSLVVMDAWLAGIEADRSEAPLETKVLRARPADAVDSCWLAGRRQPSSALCDAVYTRHRLARQVAGMPATADVLKCALRPVAPADLAGLSPAQQQRLQRAFPTGVCDWARPGVAQGPPIGTWLGYPGAAGDAVALPR